MIKVENIDVWGFEHAIRGARNALQSWSRSDSRGCGHFINGDFSFELGKNDLDLLQRLYKAGSSHRKALRQIFVSMDIIAPDYFFKEFSTYKVGTVENSTSTMHTIHKKKFELDDFSHEHLFDNNEIIVPLSCERGDFRIINNTQWLMFTCDLLNNMREVYLKTKDKKYWWQIIQLLPMSYNYKRTITMNYENVVTMINQRTGHKLDEWGSFIEVLKSLPYLKEIIGDE